MWRNYLTIAWRNIIKNGVFSAINIFGLAVGLMSCILIMLFVREESGFDRWLKDSDRLVHMHTAYIKADGPSFLTVRSAGMMMPAVRDYAKNEIEDGVRLIPFGMTVRKGEDAFDETLTMADGSFFNIFDLPFVHGDANSSFTKPLDTIISEKMALKYCGRTDVIGETLTLCCLRDNTVPMTISGVIKDLPQATHLDLDILVYLQPEIFAENDSVLNTWTSVNVYTYFKMRPGVNVAQLQERLTYWVNNESQFRDSMSDFSSDGAEKKQASDFMQHKLMAVPDLHLQARKDAGNMGDLSPMGDQKMISTFVIVAVLILLIACINFMNLATARASQRAREVAMRKVLGASRGQVALQFLAEAVAIVMISLLFALVAVELVLPLYNQALGRELTFELFNDLPMLFSLLIAVIAAAPNSLG